MSYVHCPSCARAYNLARETACPACRPAATPATPPVDPTDDIIHAVEELARTMARATPIEIVAAGRLLDYRVKRLALPAPGAPTGPSPQLLRAVRAALAGPKFDDAPPARRAHWRDLIDMALVRLAPRLPERTGQSSMRDRARAFTRRVVAAALQA